MFTNREPILEKTTVNHAKILLIEDNPGDATIVQVYLSQTDFADCEIVHCDTLADGLQRIAAGEEFLAILLDLKLPDSLGLPTLQKVVEAAPLLNVIVMTGTSDTEMGLTAVQMGAQDYLVKNEFDADQLAKTLRFSIERNRVLKRLEQTQRLARIGSWDFDPSQSLLSASTEFFNIFEIPVRRSLTIDQLSQLCPTLAALLEELLRTAAEKGSCTFERTIETCAGYRKYLYFHCESLSLGTEPNCFHGIVHDITERQQLVEMRKARELAEQSAQMKMQFLASVSHEMRTPMNAILGMSNILLDMQLPDEQHKLVKSIHHSSGILLGIVNDILQISSLQNGKVALEPETFDLEELLQGIESVFRFKSEEKGLDFFIEKPQDLPPLLRADKLRLNQVLYNLLGNAVKFTDMGHIALRIKIKEKNEQTIWLRFEVADTGLGIPPEKIDSMFEAFTRLRSKDRIIEGTGLGLAICKNLIELFGGTIGATSQPGQGSTFFFEIPLDIVSEDELPAEATKTVELLPEDAAFRVLLVEDHKLNQVVAKQTLMRRWPKVTIELAENGQQAVEMLQANDYDIVLMDVQMPLMDGFEATRYIRNELPEPKRSVPVLAMTAHAHISLDDQFSKAGMDDFVIKPFEPQDLFEKISKYVRKP